jgi:hypothetical protein
MVDAHGHAKAVGFYFIQPLRSRQSLLDWLGKRCGGMKRGRGESLRLCAAARPTGLNGL